MNYYQGIEYEMYQDELRMEIIEEQYKQNIENQQYEYQMEQILSDLSINNFFMFDIICIKIFGVTVDITPEIKVRLDRNKIDELESRKKYKQS